MPLDDRIQQITDAVADRIREALAGHLQELVEETQQAAALERDEAVAGLRRTHAADLDAAVAAAVTSAREEAASQHEATLREARETHERERAEAIETVRRTFEEETAGNIAAARAEASGLLDAARGEAAGALAAFQREAADDLASVHTEVARLTDELAAAKAELSSHGGATGVDTAVAGAWADERQADMACGERLLEVVHQIDHAGSLSSVLDELLRYAHEEAGRAALLLVQGPTLRTWRVLGDDNGAIPEAFDHSANDALAAAANSDANAATAAVSAVLPGLATGRVGLAVPLHVGGQTVAVLYADEGTSGGRCHPSAWPEMIEIATRHAGRCLELLTATRASAMQANTHSAPTPHRADRGWPPAMSAETLPEPVVEEETARRHARLAVAEIRLYNEQAVLDGRRARDLRSRLASDIVRARHLYEARIPPTFALRHQLFEEELVRTLAEGDPTLMGKDT